MKSFENVQDLENDTASDSANTTSKSPTNHGMKARSTKARKRPNNASTGSRVSPVDQTALDQRLEDCKDAADESHHFLNRTNDALYLALAKSYVWWRACNLVDGRFNRYLDGGNIKVKNGTREFSSLIRLTFGLNGNGKSDVEKRLETKTVNRFATAMDSIHRHFATEKLTFGDEAAVIAHIRNARGVEALNQQQFAHERQNTAGGPAVKTDERQNNRLKRIESFFRGLGKRTSFIDTDIQRGEGGLVPLVGRVGKNFTIDVVAVVPCADEVFKNLLLNNDMDLDKVPDDINFFSEVLSLGEVIKDGMLSNYPVKNGADITRKTTEKQPRERLLLVQGSNAHAVVGLTRTESSIVVHAEPKFDLKWPVHRDVYMDASSRRWYEKNVIPPSKRNDCDCEIASSGNATDSDICITITSPQMNKPKSLYMRGYDTWAKGRDDQHGQLMVDVERDIRWDFEATIDPAAFETINREYLQPYSKLRKANTRAATLSMRFANGAWQFRHQDAPDIAYPVQLSTMATKSRWLRFIGLEIAAVAQKIVDLKSINEITIRGSYNGLLQFGIQTNAGTYTIHIPAVRENGQTHSLKLLTKYAIIRGPHDSVIEADG